MKNYKFSHFLKEEDNIFIIAKDIKQSYEILHKWYENHNEYYLN